MKIYFIGHIRCPNEYFNFYRFRPNFNENFLEVNSKGRRDSIVSVCLTIKWGTVTV